MIYAFIGLMVGLMILASACGEPGDNRIRVAHNECFEEYEGMSGLACVDEYLATLWDHPNLKAATSAWWTCNQELNTRNPGNAVHPTRGGAMRTILPGRSWDDFPTKSAVDKRVNEQIRNWNKSNPGLNCQLAE